MASLHLVSDTRNVNALSQRFTRCRLTTMALIEGLSDADLTVQSMDDASPGKWHIAHTTWFFETFLLVPHALGYEPFDARFGFLFNSYYEAIGPRHARARRGLLSRPTLAEIKAYRGHVDEAMVRLIEHGLSQAQAALIELGIQHEQQHQELLLTDTLHLFAQNPLLPAMRRTAREQLARHAAAALEWVAFEGGRITVGAVDTGFAFDSETPRHDVLLRPYVMGSRLVTNREWLEFMDGGGYASPGHWLSDGWARVNAEGWQAPLYWRLVDGTWRQMGLRGEAPVEWDAPVSHISFFEADAYARWAGARLPTEFEWEHAAQSVVHEGNFADDGWFRPIAAKGNSNGQLQQMFGDVWEWTASPYVAYPGFRTAPGAVGEYNGKFMSGQFVLRGGSCATPAGHVRASYRNFFYPHQRWQFAGLRLCKDAQL